MSLNHKLRSPSSPCLLFCCFQDGHAAAAAAYHEAASSSDDCDDGSNPREAARLPCSIRYKCRSLVARIGRCRWRQGHVAGAASEFGYDPMSYALNFEDDRSWESDEELPARNFSARLPASPDRLLPAKLPREVVACS
ncbi:uncharacterized protein LOC115686200 [Syzygium oleosum]|uniref:uncharacterized protein LOC115686200 n=1 Tax=Syzygium oleosum TaxID=219896 RepID=UPI0011D19F7A|nr:uncharacterized protein LOC115686200 [Syzygium oleosum]